ncbi:MAG: hypothetical protein HQL38_03920 [Alphaproteobacteria bacterium]|nr:hypothetical protein [Alphaproteobacteria bacterium]
MPFAEFADLKSLDAARAARAARKSVEPSLGAPAQSRRAMTSAMFLRHMEEVERETSRDRIGTVVSTVYPKEVEGVIRRASDTRARYLAALLDIDKRKGPLTTEDVDSLRNLRGEWEEMDHGVQYLKDAIAKGLVTIDGLAPERY